ncbi:hypothetical protein PIB30_054752 [Stylosanthes scabra]|uniref:Uncharacterized protein n=1 Tax=Stylosanthes scabra TaxID=79078 RepID=A0ABU6UIA3_9FABA|nr:hypothetical protein [Stylosanthes scabra]
MVFYNMKKYFLFITILMLSLHQINALRPLKLRGGDGQSIINEKNKLILMMQSLPRGPVTGSQPNPCSTVPGQRRGRCTAEVNHGAYAAPSPQPLFPGDMVVNNFGVARSINNASDGSS